jgi:hypothetical protein
MSEQRDVRAKGKRKGGEVPEAMAVNTAVMISPALLPATKV